MMDMRTFSLRSFSGNVAFPRSWGIFTASAVTAGVFGWSCALLFWAVATPSPAKSFGDETAREISDRTDRRAFSNFNPFRPAARSSNDGPRAAPGANRAVAEAPETSLNLKLFGVRAMGEGGGAAIIGSSVGEQAAYAVGDALVSGARLHAIEPTRIVIARDGVLESLYLEGLDPAQRRRPEAAAVESGDAHEDLETRGRAASVRRAATAAGRGSEIFGEVLEPFPGVRFEPRQNGEAFTVKADPEVQASLGALGLRDGDVVIALNGAPATRAAAETAFRNAAGDLEITVERDGVRRTLTLRPQ